MATESISYGTYATPNLATLQSLASDATDTFSCYQSGVIDNTSERAEDYEVIIDLSTANTAPGDAKAVFVYVLPAVWKGSDWVGGGNYGTTGALQITAGLVSISEPNDLKGPVVLPYKVAQQRLQGWLSVAAICGVMPDGWQIVIRNTTGAALSTGCVVGYRPIHYTSA